MCLKIKLYGVSKKLQKYLMFKDVSSFCICPLLFF